MAHADIRQDAGHPATHPARGAMQDEDINRRLAANPDDPDAKLDAGLDQSMDASDPPANVQPGGDGEPVPSSGYDEAGEEQRLTA